jgi:hypothetical protein
MLEERELKSSFAAPPLVDDENRQSDDGFYVGFRHSSP